MCCGLHSCDKWSSGDTATSRVVIMGPVKIHDTAMTIVPLHRRPTLTSLTIDETYALRFYTYEKLQHTEHCCLNKNSAFASNIAISGSSESPGIHPEHKVYRTIHRNVLMLRISEVVIVRHAGEGRQHIQQPFSRVSSSRIAKRTSADRVS